MSAVPPRVSCRVGSASVAPGQVGHVRTVLRGPVALRSRSVKSLRSVCEGDGVQWLWELLPLVLCKMMTYVVFGSLYKSNGYRQPSAMLCIRSVSP